VLPCKRHKAVGKETDKTSYIERLNNTFRQRIGRLVRKTLSFSKNLENHIGAIWFNTAGPCQADIHYMLLSTVRLPEIVNLIAQRNYFEIHAPRQVGKTTAMLALAQELTASGQYTAVMLSLEVGARDGSNTDGMDTATTFCGLPLLFPIVDD
jgi:hypothetical protein